MGPTPKAPGQRRRRNATPGARVLSTEVVPAPISLPVELVDLHPLVLEFWRDITQSPMANEWDRSDLHGLIMLADLYNAYWNCPPEKLTTKAMLAAEIRLQRQAYGLSPIDRRRLAWEIERAEQAQDARARRKAGTTAPSERPDPRLAYEPQNPD